MGDLERTLSSRAVAEDLGKQQLWWFCVQEGPGDAVVFYVPVQHVWWLLFGPGRRREAQKEGGVLLIVRVWLRGDEDLLRGKFGSQRQRLPRRWGIYGRRMCGCAQMTAGG